MARPKKKNNHLLTLLIVATVIFIGYWGTSKYLASKKMNGPGPNYPDNSALGVTYNFYQWYTSCVSENESESPGTSPSECYKNTAYLKSDLVNAMNKQKDPILCGKHLDFRSVAVREVSTSGDTAQVAVSNHDTSEVVANVTAQQITGNWQITSISCN